MFNQLFEERNISIPIYDIDGNYRQRLHYRYLTDALERGVRVNPYFRQQIQISLRILQQDLDNYGTGYKYVSRRHRNPRMVGEEWGIDDDALQYQIKNHKEFLRHPLFYFD